MARKIDADCKSRRRADDADRALDVGFLDKLTISRVKTTMMEGYAACRQSWSISAGVYLALNQHTLKIGVD